jgi:hypothetical protein
MSDESKTDRLPGKLCRWTPIVAITMLVAYVGAYYAMVDQPTCVSGPGPWDYYKIGGHTLPIQAQTFFKPIHLVDRNLRPEMWWIENQSAVVPPLTPAL